MSAHAPIALQGPVGDDGPFRVALAADTDPAAVRADLVERVRREIANGTYETPEKWDVALDRLLDRLERGPG